MRSRTSSLAIAVTVALCPAVVLGRGYTYLAYDQLRDALYDLQTAA